MAIEEDLSQWEIASTGKMISYGIGYVIINFLLGGAFLTIWYYYEVEIGVNVALMGIAFGIFAIWNMLNDPLVGYLTDKPLKWTKRWGLRAPWVVISAIPILIFFLLLWIPPDPETTPEITLFLWFIIMTCLFDTFFSIYNDHVYGGFTNQFPSEYERRRAFAIATLLMGGLMTGMNVVGSALIVYGDRSSFITVAIFYVIVLAILNVILFAGIKESEEMKQMFITAYEKAEKIGFFKTMKKALGTKNFRVSLAGYTCWSIAAVLASVSGIFIYKDVWQLPLSYSIPPLLIGLAAFLGAIPFWSNYARKHGFKKCYWTCMVLYGIGFLPMLFISREMGFPLFYILIIIFGFIGALPYSGIVIMLMPVASDTYDEVATKIGQRVDATMIGLRTFFFRVAYFVQAIVFFTVMTITAYNPDPKAVQTPLAVWGIRVQAALIPAIIFIVMGLIFRQFYTLEGAEKEALVKKLKDMKLYR